MILHTATSVTRQRLTHQSQNILTSQYHLSSEYIEEDADLRTATLKIRDSDDFNSIE